MALWGGIFGGTLGELWSALAATFPSDLTNVVAIAATSTAIDISLLGCHFLALRADGTVIRWDSSSLPPKTDVPPGLTHVVAVAPGAGHCLALRADGTVVAWGNPARTDLPAGLSSVVAVAAGFAHSLALCADGRIVAWGGSGSWHPEYGGTNVPPSLTNAVTVAAGLYHGLALRADGTVVAWPPDMPATGVPSGLTNVVAIAGGVYQGVALIADGPPTLQARLNHPTMAADGFAVSVPTQSGRVYRLDYKHSLADTDWTPLPLVAGTGHERMLTDPAADGSSQRFYRVRRW